MPLMDFRPRMMLSGATAEGPSAAVRPSFGTRSQTSRFMGALFRKATSMLPPVEPEALRRCHSCDSRHHRRMARRNVRPPPTSCNTRIAKPRHRDLGLDEERRLVLEDGPAVHAVLVSLRPWSALGRHLLLLFIREELRGFKAGPRLNFAALLVLEAVLDNVLLSTSGGRHIRATLRHQTFREIGV